MLRCMGHVASFGTILMKADLHQTPTVSDSAKIYRMLLLQLNEVSIHRQSPLVSGNRIYYLDSINWGFNVRSARI